jgi:Flp pilus assembly protein TadB
VAAAEVGGEEEEEEVAAEVEEEGGYTSVLRTPRVSRQQSTARDRGTRTRPREGRGARESAPSCVRIPRGSVIHVAVIVIAVIVIVIVVFVVVVVIVLIVIVIIVIVIVIAGDLSIGTARS